MTVDSLRKLSFVLLTSDPRARRLGDHLPGMRGDLMIDMMRREGLRSPMLLYSSAPEPVLQDAATRAGAVGYIVKGCSQEALLARIRQVIREHAPQRVAQMR